MTDGPETAHVTYYTEGPLSLSDVFDLLSNTERRHLLHFCRQYSAKAIPINDVCRSLSASPFSLPDPDGNRVVRLHHSHIPALERAGILEYDERTDTIQYNGDVLVEHCLDWAVPYDFE